MPTKLILLGLYIVSLNCADSATYYDQRQTGDFNVQVDLKNLQIIALMKGDKEDYMDYDYTYDYSEMTIKPPKTTTKKPTISSTAADNLQINATTVPSVAVNTNTTLENVIQQSTVVNNIKSINASTTEQSLAVKVEPNINAYSTPKDCKKGFVLNESGECILQFQNTDNALLKLVKLSQKLKSRKDSQTESVAT